MKPENLERSEYLTAQRHTYETIAYRHVCAMCAAPLMVPWNGQKDTYELACSKDRTHQGYERLQSLYETWRRGGTLPVEVAQALEFKYGKRREKT